MAKNHPTSHLAHKDGVPSARARFSARLAPVAAWVDEFTLQSMTAGHRSYRKQHGLGQTDK
jgi:hypothetical protein